MSQKLEEPTYEKIGSHHTWDFSYDFFLVEGVVKARVDKGPFLNVRLPHFHNLPTSEKPQDDVQKLERTLKIAYFRPSHKPGEDFITFEAIPQSRREWKKIAQLDYIENNKFIVLTDETLGFFVGNMVKEWNWKTGKQGVIFVCSKEIEDIGKNTRGELIVQDKEKNLWVNQSIIPQSDLKDYKISLSQYIFFENARVLKEIDWENAIVLDDGYIAMRLNNKLVIRKYSQGGDHRDIFEKENIQNLSRITKRIVQYEHDQKEIQWSLDDDESESVLSDGNSNYLCDGRRVRSEENTINIQNRSVQFNVTWGLSGYLPLSDNSLMVASVTSGARIFFLPEEKINDKKFTSQSNEEGILLSEILGSDVNVGQLQELPNGYIAVRSSQKIHIIKFGVITNKEEECLQKIRSGVYSREIYNSLEAELKNESDKCKLPQFYEVGEQSARLHGDEYYSRRFKEKHKKISNSPLPSHVQFKKKRFDEKGDVQFKRRLFVGEGDFSFTKAFLQKHNRQSLGSCITATELNYLDNQNQNENIQYLKEQGVTVDLNVDATKIASYYRSHRFHRIHWNCPFGLAGASDRAEHISCIPAFFKQCSQLQVIGDRVHITLDQPKPDYFIHRQIENPIALGSCKAGYRLIRKRNFEESRYPGYHHIKTNGTLFKIGEDSKREFVFEKTDIIKDDPQEMMDKDKKSYRVERKDDTPYFLCSTDEDSSDCEE